MGKKRAFAGRRLRGQDFTVAAMVQAFTAFFWCPDTMREAGSQQIASLVARYETVARTRGFRALAARFERAATDSLQRPAA